MQRGEVDLVDSAKVPRVQVEVLRGEAEVDLDEGELISCTRLLSSTSCPSRAVSEHFLCRNPQCLHKSLHQNQTKKARKCDKAHDATTEAFSRPFLRQKTKKNQRITASTFRESYISPEGQRGEQNLAEFACLQ